MAETISYASPTTRPAVNTEDGRGFLLAFGVLSIAVGVMGLFGVTERSDLWGRFLSGGGGGSRPELAAGRLLLTVLWQTVYSGGMIVIGFGACVRKRWVRGLALAVAWPSLLIGLMTTDVRFGDYLLLPGPGGMGFPIGRPAPRTSGAVVDPGQAYLLSTGLVLFLADVALPLVYVCYFQRRRMWAMLAELDPAPHWTDRCSPMAFGLCIGMAGAAVLSMSLAGFPLVPVFGEYLHNSPWICVGVFLALVASACVTFWNARGGWWLSLVVVAAIWGSLMGTLLADVPYAVAGSSLGSYAPSASGQSTFLQSLPTINVAVAGVAALGYILFGLIRNKPHGTPVAAIVDRASPR
ncbi:MAG: hypothetical protein ACHRHE_02320 [Tepidisphaerales bacterium]